MIVIQKIKLIRFKIINFIYQILDCLVPKNKKLFVFSQVMGRYNDNSRQLFEYLQSISHVSAIWFYRNDFECVASSFKSRMLPMYGLKAFLISLRAKYFVISHGTGDMGVYKSRFKMVLNVWHGTAIKAMALAIPEADKKKILKERKYYDMFFVASKIEACYMASILQIPLSKMVITGLPRQDLFFSGQIHPEIFNSLNIKEKKIILYAPTFREGEETIFFPGVKDFSYLVKILEKYNAVILLRSHINDSKAIDKLKQIISIDSEKFFIFHQAVQGDINPILPSVDLMITDYSSIYIDTLLIDVPVIFVPYDYETYVKKRSFAYDYNLVTPGPKVMGGEDLIKAIESGLKNRLAEYSAHRDFVKKMFHQHQDGKNCERVFEHIMKNEQACS